MRILIVEDEVYLAEALSEIFSKNKYIVDTVYDGMNGLDYALSNIYDIIILDIMLPKMNGIDVLKNIKKEKITTPVILLTAKDELADKIVGLDTGADDYVTKPFATDELLARIRAVIRRKTNIEDSNVLSFEEVLLNLKTSELSYNNKSIKLGLKELNIMELLIINGKQIITKENLIEKVWGFDAEVEYNNVEVYISFLRKKLSHIKSPITIKTSRGLGYSLERIYD